MNSLLLVGIFCWIIPNSYAADREEKSPSDMHTIPLAQGRVWTDCDRNHEYNRGNRLIDRLARNFPSSRDRWDRTRALLEKTTKEHDDGEMKRIISALDDLVKKLL